LNSLNTYRNLLFLFAFTFSLGSNAQLKDPTFWKPAVEKNKARTNLVVFGGGGAAVITLAGLYSIWYLEYPQSEIHSTNDWDNWMQMDKIGHANVSYVVGQSGYDAFKWAGWSEKKAVWHGDMVGFTYLTAVEIMDGFSDGWGFSWGDMAFNTLGAGLFIGQQLGWKEQRILLKFSYHNTEHPPYNKDGLLGTGGLQNIIKNYNGQTYWLSVNPRSFTKEKMAFWPKWLNVAGGYGATGMIGATQNPSYPDEIDKEFVRHRQYYLSLDIDLRKIPMKSGFLKTLVHTLSFIKIPAPTVQFNGSQNGGTTFHWLYF